MQPSVGCRSKLRAALATALTVCALAVTIGTATAQAGGIEMFCGGWISRQTICHGPFVGNGVGFYGIIAEERVHGYALCATAQAWNGHWFNVYEWDCAVGNLYYQFPLTAGYPSLTNPNSVPIRPGADFLWK